MPRPDLTDITLVLDRSGSMASVRESTIAAFNQFLRSQRKAAGIAQMTLVQFDNEYEPLYESVVLEKAPELHTETFVPRGTTALLDAMGQTILRTGQRLADLPDTERPGTVLFVTLTDGHENASREFNSHDIDQLIIQQRSIYSWQFVFLAANQDAIATAANIGIDAAQALTFADSPAGVKNTFEALNTQVADVRSRKAAGMPAAPLDFTPEQRSKARD